MTAMVKSPRPTASAMRARPFVRGARSCTQHSPSLPEQALLFAGSFSMLVGTLLGRQQDISKKADGEYAGQAWKRQILWHLACCGIAWEGPAK